MAGTEKLEHLLDQRMSSPVPSHEGVVDSLYEFIQNHQRTRGQYFRFYFGTDAPLDEAEKAIPGRKNPFRDYLERGKDALPRHILPMLCFDDDLWVQWMNRHHGVQLFGANTYIFPLWCADEEQSEPLALVLLDMTYAPPRAPREVAPITRVFLDLAAEILASRRYHRLIRGWLPFLPDLYHGRALKEVWSHCKDRLRPLFSPEQQDTASEIFNEMDGKVKEYYEKHREMEKCLGGDLAGLEVIHDLGTHLGQLQSEYVRQYPLQNESEQTRTTPGVWIEGDWEDLKGLELPCDRHVFDRAFRSLVENALAAKEEQGRASGRPVEDVKIIVRATVKSSDCGPFERIVRLDITDNGPGIAPGIEDFIFLSRFTFRPLQVSKVRHRGMGLAYARALLTAYHGDLQLLTPQTKDHPTLGNAGATFRLTFGIPPREDLESPGPEVQRIVVISRSADVTQKLHPVLQTHFPTAELLNRRDLPSNEPADPCGLLTVLLVDFSALDEDEIADWQSATRQLARHNDWATQIFLVANEQVAGFTDFSQTEIVELVGTWATLVAYKIRYRASLRQSLHSRS